MDLSLQKVMVFAAKKVVNQIELQLSKKKMNVSGNLKDSIEYNINTHLIVFKINKYGDYQDTGTKGLGEGKMTDEMKKRRNAIAYGLTYWTKAKGLDDYRWAIATNIMRKGLPSNPSKHDNRGWIDVTKIDLGLDKELMKYLSTIVNDEIVSKMQRMFIT